MHALDIARYRLVMMMVLVVMVLVVVVVVEMLLRTTESWWLKRPPRSKQKHLVSKNIWHANSFDFLLVGGFIFW